MDRRLARHDSHLQRLPPPADRHGIAALLLPLVIAMVLQMAACASHCALSWLHSIKGGQGYTGLTGELWCRHHTGPRTASPEERPARAHVHHSGQRAAAAAGCSSRVAAAVTGSAERAQELRAAEQQPVRLAGSKRPVVKQHPSAHQPSSSIAIAVGEPGSPRAWRPAEPAVSSALRSASCCWSST